MNTTMMQSLKFPYLNEFTDRVLPRRMPYLPLSLGRNGISKRVFGLVDTGSTVGVLPYEIGIDLGAVWADQTIPLSLVGNLANFEARALLVDATIEGFPQFELAFAWTKAEKAPLILGQTNFFSVFNVCFDGESAEFELTGPKPLIR